MVVETIEREKRTDRLFFALSDATRRDIVTQTLDRERSVSELGRLYPISLTAVQKHVEVLVDAGLVSKHRSGREQLVRGEVNQLRRATYCSTNSKRCGAPASNASKTSSTKPLERKAHDRLECRQERRGQDNGHHRRVHDVHHQRVAAVGRPAPLERWWGPPGFPATFEHHDLTPGGTITYFMSGPDGGDRFDGTWNVVEVDAPTRLVVEDAIVEDDGTPSDGNSMTRMEIDIEAAGDTTRMILTTHFDSLEGMEQAIAMGVVEGMKAWMSQIDALLAEVAA